MAKCLVIGLQSYNFKDDSGKEIKGNNIFFLDKSDSDGYTGFKTGKVSVPDGLVKAFAVVPGFYDLDFGVKVGAGGKVAVSLESVQFMSGVKFNEEKLAAAAAGK